MTPDHLDWHGSLERYVADKARSSEPTADDVAVIDADDQGSVPDPEPDHPRARQSCE